MYLAKFVLEWETESIKNAQGILGFTVYDADSNLVHQRNPSKARENESDSIALNNIETIKFETNSDDGFHGLISVKKEGINQVFHCIDCLPSSSSTELSRLYLDTDMKAHYSLPGAANCQNSCTFERGPAPTTSKFNLLPAKLTNITRVVQARK